MDNEEIIQEETPKTKKELFMERLRVKYPEMEEEEMYGQHLNHMDEMDRASEAHRQLGEKLTSHPKGALILADIMDGKHPKVAIKRYYSDNDDEDISEEELSAQLLEAERERLAEEAEMEGMKAEYEQNLANSAADIQAFKEKYNLTDEAFAEFIETVIEFTGDLLAGKLNAQLLELGWKGRNYDSDLANEIPLAEERGRISERNAKIEAQKKRMEGDGLPVTTTSTAKSKDINIPYRKSAWDR